MALSKTHPELFSDDASGVSRNTNCTEIKILFYFEMEVFVQKTLVISM